MNQSKFRYFTPALFVFTALWCIIYFTCFENPLQLFATNWPLILVGIGGAIIGNLTAIGGGLVFIPVIIFIYHLDPVKALKLAFVSQSVGMTSGAAGWIKRKEVPFELLKWTIPSLIIGSLVSSFIFHPQPMMVKGLFGPISVLVGALTLITLNRKGTLISLPSKAMIPVFIISLIGGMITGWVAIGEGEIIAAFCMLAYGLNSNRSIGLGVVLLSVNSLLLGSLHAFYFGGVPWDLAIFTMLGCLWGGRLGPYIAQFIDGKKVKTIFAVIAILDGALIIYQVGKKFFGW